MKGRVWAVVATAVALTVALPASADTPPQGPDTATAKVETESPARRPIALALLAAVFLVISGVVGANDRPDGDPPAAPPPPPPAG